VNPILTLAIGTFGFVVGNLLFAAVGRWIAGVYTIVKDPTKAGARAKHWKVASVTLFSSGPWMLVAVGFFAYHVQSKPWAMPLFIGLATAILFFSAITIHFWRKALQRQKNAAPVVTEKSLLVRQSRWLQRKRNFMRFGTLAFGGFLWVWNVWGLWDFNHSVWWILFLLVICMLGGIVWSWLMWHFFSLLRQPDGIDAPSSGRRTERDS
jgi:hypothetical protein